MRPRRKALPASQKRFGLSQCDEFAIEFFPFCCHVFLKIKVIMKKVTNSRVREKVWVVKGYRYGGMVGDGNVVDVCSRNHWDKVIGAEEIIDSSEDFMWVGVEGELPVYRVMKLPNVLKVK